MRKRQNGTYACVYMLICSINNVQYVFRILYTTNPVAKRISFQTTDSARAVRLGVARMLLPAALILIFYLKKPWLVRSSAVHNNRVNVFDSTLPGNNADISLLIPAGEERHVPLSGPIGNLCRRYIRRCEQCSGNIT